MNDLHESVIPAAAKLPRSNSDNARKIGLHHLAFFRGYLEGLSLEEGADRYLETGSELAAAKRTLRWIRDELIACARKTRPALVRLLKIAPHRLDASASTLKNQATLEEFRIDHDPEGFYTEQELIELFVKAHAEPTSQGKETKQARRARLRKRQLDAVWWLQGWVSETPARKDVLAAWLDPVIVGRLHAANLHTVDDLLAFIARHGRRWWRFISGLGEEGAGRLETWLKNNGLLSELPGDCLQPYAHRLPKLIASRPMEAGIVPLEYLLVPESLSGVTGCNRGEGGALAANDDYQAINAWLASCRDNPHTQRSYRSQAERFLLWALFEKRKAMSSLSVEDCIDYRDFLSALGSDSATVWRWRLPESRWIGPRSAKRWSLDWRPFAGALSVESQALAHTVLVAMCEWLVRQRYLHVNPWDGVPPRIRAQQRIKTDHALTQEQWRTVIGHCQRLPDGERSVRLTFILWLAYSTGLRLSELTAARLGDLQPVPGSEGYELVVVGKRMKRREVPVAPVVMTVLKDYLIWREITPEPEHWPADIPLIATLASTSRGRAPISDSALYGLLTRYFAQVAAAAERESPGDAARLRQASTHWLRHTHATHAVAADVPLDVVQMVLGHESLSTTTLYVTADRRRRQREIQRFVAHTASGLGV